MKTDPLCVDTEGSASQNTEVTLLWYSDSLVKKESENYKFGCGGYL